MSEQQPSAKRAPQRRMGAGVVAGLAVLFAFVALGISIYGLIKQSAKASLETQLPTMIAAGGGLTVAAMIAMIRSMSFWDILEAVWDALALVFAMIGAVLKGIWNAILGLFGWD